MLNDVYHDCAHAHVPHHTTGVSLLRIAPFFPLLLQPPFHLCASAASGSFCKMARAMIEFSSTCLDAKHSHFWSDDTNACIHERWEQQFTENVPARWISFPVSSKGEDLFWWHSECAAGSCCFRLHNWNGAAVISWSLLSWTSCLTACHRDIDPLSLSAALHGKWYLMAEKDLHLSRWVKRFRSYLFWRKKKKKIQACSNSKAHICLNNLQRHRHNTHCWVTKWLSVVSKCCGYARWCVFGKEVQKNTARVTVEMNFSDQNLLILYNTVKKKVKIKCRRSCNAGLNGKYNIRAALLPWCYILAGWLRSEVWNLAHPSCQAPI